MKTIKKREKVKLLKKVSQDYTNGFIDGLLQGQSSGMDLAIDMIKKMANTPNSLDLKSKDVKK